MKTRWIHERRRDQFYRMAKKQGYRSRAAFKLMQTNRKYNFLRKGDRVVDLGAAPGGWLQAAAEIVGDSGFVLGVDTQPIKSFTQRNIETVVMDISEDESILRIQSRTDGPVDVVLADLSPNVSGVWEVDHARQIYLSRRALEIATEILNPGGSFFTKLFHGPEFKPFKEDAAKLFETVRIVKPAASRSESSESYLLATGLKQ